MGKSMKVVLSLVAIIILGGIAFMSYKKETQKTIAILLYEDFNMLEVVGAYQTFPGLFSANYRMKFIAKEKGMVKSSYLQSLEADYGFGDVIAADILFIPGGDNMEKILKDEVTLAWIKAVNEKSTFTLSTGSGTLLLGEAGLLKGKKVASQWYDKAQIEEYGGIAVTQDYINDGKYYTGMGASAAIDMALELINVISGPVRSKSMQLFIAYDPLPPVQAKMYEQADSSVRAIVDQLMEESHLDTVVMNKTIAMMLYDKFTMLDMTGPYQVFKELRGLGYEMKFVADRKEEIVSDMALSYRADYTFDEIEKADILFIPGGSATDVVMKQKEVIDWVRKIDATTKYSTSVCTGSLVYGKAGLLENKSATSHWYTGQFLKDYGATYTKERYTIDGKYITGAGVSSGIDLALMVVKQEIGVDYAKAIQLKLGYFPNPPYDSGSMEKADKAIGDRLMKMFSGAKKRYEAAKASE